MFGNLRGFEGSVFDEFRRIQDEMDELFSQWTWPAGIRSAARGAFPAINVGATADKVDVYVFAPGLDANAIDVSLQQNLLTVRGKRHFVLDKRATYYRQERFGGDFHRAITLPDDVDPEQVEARYRDGILQVSVRRREAAKPRQIEIH